MSKKKHQVRKTLLVVGEGDGEEAFLRHLRELYCTSGQGVSVTIRNAHGKGPEHVVDHAIRINTIYSYDRCACLLDTDIQWTGSLIKRAKQHKLEMIGSQPCLEGLLLTILGETVPTYSSDCKKFVEKLLRMDLTESKNYSKHFPKNVVESARLQLPTLNSLLNLFEGY